MKISFYGQGGVTLASYRMHILDLSYYLRQHGHQVSIGANPENVDVLIHDKRTRKFSHPDKINVIFTPPCNDINVLKKADFILCLLYTSPSPRD